jgi:uncharacterized protein (DUF2147 family)
MWAVYLLMMILYPVNVPPGNADAILGAWINEEKEGRIEIYKSGNQYAGRIVWLKEPNEPDGTPKKDKKNSSESLRKRNILNLVILSGFKYEDGRWTGGEIYDPKSGKTYSCNMKLKANKLEIRGYIGLSVFGRTTTWTRYQ